MRWLRLGDRQVAAGCVLEPPVGKCCEKSNRSMLAFAAATGLRTICVFDSEFLGGNFDACPIHGGPANAVRKSLVHSFRLQFLGVRYCFGHLPGL